MAEWVTPTTRWATGLTGNRGIAGLTTSSYGFNTNDELVADSYGIYTLASGGYDGNGNTTSAGGSSYGYDAMNQLTDINTSTNYGYDGDGNRVAKLYYDFQYNAIMTFYMVDDRNPSGYPQVVEEYLSDTNLRRYSGIEPCL